MALEPVVDYPFNAETPLPALTTELTPTNLFYVRNHFDVPPINPFTWRLQVSGLVKKPLTLALKDLQTLPQKDLTVTLECAGNGRKNLVPQPSGVPWGHGAVSTAVFTGIPLKLFMAQAGIHPTVQELVFTGADCGEVAPGKQEAYARSLPIEMLSDPDILLAWAMNGEPLTPDHGFPLRLVVPQWYGMASVKWLTEISATNQPFKGFFQENYRYETETSSRPITKMRIRSLIGWPIHGAHLALRPIEISGIAWSGRGAIQSIYVSTDGGASWIRASRKRPASPYACTPWRLVWQPPCSGNYTLMVRALDRLGNQQPWDPVQNLHGYGNNSIQQIQISVGSIG